MLRPLDFQIKPADLYGARPCCAICTHCCRCPNAVGQRCSLCTPLTACARCWCLRAGSSHPGWTRSAGQNKFLKPKSSIWVDVKIMVCRIIIGIQKRDHNFDNHPYSACGVPVYFPGGLHILQEPGTPMSGLDKKDHTGGEPLCRGLGLRVPKESYVHSPTSMMD